MVLDQMRDVWHGKEELCVFFSQGKRNLPGGASITDDQRRIIRPLSAQRLCMGSMFIRHCMPDKWVSNRVLYMASADEIYITIRG